MIERGRLGLKTKRGVRPRVSTGIVLQDKIGRQMPGAVHAAEGNANEASGERGITVS